MKRSDYSVDVRGSYVLVLDLDQGGASVTNDAESVIADLHRARVLEGRRVLYRDSEGSWDELLQDGTKFLGFRHVGGTTEEEAIAKAEAVPAGR